MSTSLKKKITKHKHIESIYETVNRHSRPAGLSRAYVFVGQTRLKRESKAFRMIRTDQFNMYGFIENATRTKSVLYLTCKHFANRPTFDMVESWAGTHDCTDILDTSGSEWFYCKSVQRFGVIDLDRRKKSKTAIKA